MHQRCNSPAKGCLHDAKIFICLLIKPFENVFYGIGKPFDLYLCRMP